MGFHNFEEMALSYSGFSKESVFRMRINTIKDGLDKYSHLTRFVYPKVNRVSLSLFRNKISVLLK